MTPTLDKALLPTGLRDILPPSAGFEARVVEGLIAAFEGRGFARVKPPLIEFEENLLAGSGRALARQTFRMMDPASGRMLAVRPDMTLQIARIAASRLGNAPRPLRLSYAGQILRVSGSQLHPERQFGQVGAELIGSASPRADAEVTVMAAEALAGLGLEGLSIDLGLPALVPTLCADLGLAPEAAERLRDALDRKDAAGVEAAGRSAGEGAARLLGALLAATGPAREALGHLERLDLSPAAAAQRAMLAEVVGLVSEAAPWLSLTIDPTENRGFEYHDGVTFSLFSRRGGGELGRGGRYLAERRDGRSEPATGLTLFMNAVLRLLPRPGPGRRIYLPAEVGAAAGARLRDDGWMTVAGLEPVAEVLKEAERLGCTHAWIEEEAVAVRRAARATTETED